ncbi:uncharacterized protein LOC132728239 isoform X1 [Ruditapes philippinarum]|uniref:uncharacterized protein LOC132728239 isoform X1 n=1 Tax=Ruditapes philippinarum TaxID=129788 RepID=UPI00295AD9C3|nr:uncharacterized protein LOC132728239 isoform X1 [Ruditapes philippinarum]
MIARYIYIHAYLNKTKTSDCKELPPIIYFSKRMHTKVEINDAGQCRISPICSVPVITRLGYNKESSEVPTISLYLECTRDVCRSNPSSKPTPCLQGHTSRTSHTSTAEDKSKSGQRDSMNASVKLRSSGSNKRSRAVQHRGTPMCNFTSFSRQ